MYEKFYVHEITAVDLSKIYFLNEKRKENMLTKQPRFKSRLNETKILKNIFQKYGSIKRNFH